MSTPDMPWWEQGTCRDRNPEWWTTPASRFTTRQRNAAVTIALAAIDVCRACPVAAAYHAEATDPTKPRTVGVIRAGVAYDDLGRPHRRCPQCGTAILARTSDAPHCGGKVCAQLGILAAHRVQTRKAAA